MTLANKITLARIALIPFFVIFATIGGTTCDVIALVLFCVCSFTDFLDGYVARKYHQVTDFGKFVDPLADKLLICAAMVIFIDRGLMFGWMVFIILAREFIIRDEGHRDGCRLVWQGKDLRADCRRDSHFPVHHCHGRTEPARWIPDSAVRLDYDGGYAVFRL